MNYSVLITLLFAFSFMTGVVSLINARKPYQVILSGIASILLGIVTVNSLFDTIRSLNEQAFHSKACDK